jgi:peptide/nickel transport system ATP-binding protein
MNTILEVKDLSVEYRTDLETVHAVNGISFSLHRGQTLGLVGETGAGKTTTALSILRLLPKPTGVVTAGEILLEGVNLLDLSDAQMKALLGEKMSMIFQDPMSALNPIMRVGEQIAETLILHGAPHQTKKQVEQRVEETLELVGIPAFRKNEYPHQFSGGMKQRVVIAIALACQPHLLIADEPTTALDVTIQAQVLAMMSELRNKLDMSMIMITHDLGIVAQVCDDVAVMYAGEIVEYATTEQIFSPGARHPYTTGLFGSIPDLKGGTKRLTPIEGLMPDPTELPSGCKFHPRCPQKMAQCETVPPPTVAFENHLISCHLYTGQAEGGLK